jgi:hypothetical protein
MSSRRIPTDEFRALTTREQLTVIVGWVVVAFLLMLGIGGSLGLGAGVVLGVVFATLGALLWIGGF